MTRAPWKDRRSSEALLNRTAVDCRAYGPNEEAERTQRQRRNDSSWRAWSWSGRGTRSFQCPCFDSHRARLTNHKTEGGSQPERSMITFKSVFNSMSRNIKVNTSQQFISNVRPISFRSSVLVSSFIYFLSVSVLSFGLSVLPYVHWFICPLLSSFPWLFLCFCLSLTFLFLHQSKYIPLPLLRFLFRGSFLLLRAGTCLAA